MNEQWTVGSLIVLQGLFALCALSILWYQYMDWFDVGFGLISYRTANILLSELLIASFIMALLRRYPWTFTLLTLFALFHVVGGSLAGLWIKVILHALTLLVIGAFGLRHSTLGWSRPEPSAKESR